MTAVYVALWVAGVVVSGVGLYLSLVSGLAFPAAAFVVLLAVLAWELFRPASRPQPEESQ